MVNRNYARGYTAEIKTAKHLESFGFHVERGYASKGTFDLYGFRHDLILLVQCKRVKTLIKKTQSIFNRYKDELKKISEIQCPDNAYKLLAYYEDKQPGSRTATLKFYKIYSDHLEEIEIKKSI